MADLRVTRHPLALGSTRQSVEVPMGSRVLTVQLQQGSIVLWTMGDRTMPKVKRWIRLVEDDHGEIPELSDRDGVSGEHLWEYVATIQLLCMRSCEAIHVFVHAVEAI